MRLLQKLLPIGSKSISGTTSDRDNGAVRNGELFRTTVSQIPMLLVAGPEGIGKTTVLMALHHDIMQRLGQCGETVLAMYAFADYSTVEEKCAAFNRVQSGNGYVGVTLPSFHKVYEEECDRLNILAISTVDAAKRGFTSRFSAIEKLQPQIVERFKARHADLWAKVDGRKPVFFCVHQVAQQWRKSTTTRLMWAPSFWDKAGDRREQVETCRRETNLSLLVHDELKVESLVELQPDEVLSWINSMAHGDADIWKNDHSSLSNQFQSYDRYVRTHGFPTAHGEEIKVVFEDARRIADITACRWDHIVTRNTGEYGTWDVNSDVGDAGEDDAYAARHGRGWNVASRDWWHGVADRVVMLTTEAVPTAVARITADPDWSVFELETPKAPRDHVETYASRSVIGKNLATLGMEWRDNHPADDFFIVSNSVSILNNSMPHVTARGSNELIGKNILQTMTFMTPNEYERLLALNAWTGRSDLVGLRHIDEFNQTTGRNLGYRKLGR